MTQRFLLDTHVLLWWANDSTHLGPRLRTRLSTAEQVLVSDASLWELSIKVAMGKLRLRSSVLDWFTSALALHRLGGLGIERRHLADVSSLPPHHRDPFDRLLVSQARVENLALVTSDESMSRYDVEIVWDER